MSSSSGLQAFRGAGLPCTRRWRARPSWRNGATSGACTSRRQSWENAASASSARLQDTATYEAALPFLPYAKGVPCRTTKHAACACFIVRGRPHRIRLGTLLSLDLFSAAMCSSCLQRAFFLDCIEPSLNCVGINVWQAAIQDATTEARASARASVTSSDKKGGPTLMSKLLQKANASAA